MFSLPDVTITKFSESLSSYLDHPVQDLTHLEGRYSFKLEWIIPKPARTDSTTSQTEAPSDSGPTIFDAVREQLGLELKLEKRGAIVVVIDHAERSPTSN
jgi:uncharacterized protein (TIGR03435 family)